MHRGSNLFEQLKLVVGMQKQRHQLWQIYCNGKTDEKRRFRKKTDIMNSFQLIPSDQDLLDEYCTQNKVIEDGQVKPNEDKLYSTFVSASTHFLPNFGPHISFLIRLGIVLVYCFQKEIPSYLLLFEAILYIDKQHQILPTCIMNLKINSNLPVYSSLLLYYKKKP